MVRRQDGVNGGYAFGSGANLLRGANIYDHATLSWAKMSGPADNPVGINGTQTVVDVGGAVGRLAHDGFPASLIGRGTQRALQLTLTKGRPD